MRPGAGFFCSAGLGCLGFLVLATCLLFFLRSPEVKLPPTDPQIAFPTSAGDYLSRLSRSGLEHLWDERKLGR